MQEAAAATDNRLVTDRRSFSWRTVFYGFMRSRRRAPRRGTEAEPVYTDWHHPWLFLLAIGTMLMSSLDAFMTLQLLERGAVEMNPVMAALIGHSTAAFATIKMMLTATGTLALVFLSRARFLNLFRTGLILTLVFMLYGCLVCYEFVHLLRVI